MDLLSELASRLPHLRILEVSYSTWGCHSGPIRLIPVCVFIVQFHFPIPSFQFRLLRDASFRRPDEFDQCFRMLGVEPLRFDRLESL